MDVCETLKKVEKALSLRFERDGSLYISKDDAESIKEALYNSRFQNINAFIKKLGNKVVVKIILNHNWLIDFSHNKKELKNIFDVVDKDFFKHASEDVVGDNVFSTSEFKSFVKNYYLEGVSLKECSKIYKNTNELMGHRATCFKRCLKEECVLESSVSYVVQFIESEFDNYPEIYHYLQNNDRGFLSSVFDGVDDMKFLMEWVISHKITDNKDRVWNDIFLSNKREALEGVVQCVSNNQGYATPLIKILIKKYLTKLKGIDEFEASVVKLYRDNNYSTIRMVFIQMLESSRFKDKSLAHTILGEFEALGLPSGSERDVENIKRWDDSNGSKFGFKTRGGLMESVSDGRQDVSNLSTLHFFFLNLQKTDKGVILDAYEEFSDDPKLRTILSYYLSKFLLKNPIPECFFGINCLEYIDEIVRFVVELNINTSYSRGFLEEHEKHGVLTDFNRR